MPLGNPGEVAAGITKVREAIKILQMALPAFPIGSDIQKAVMKAITDMSKIAPQSEASPGLQQNTFKELQQGAQQQAPMNAVLRALQQRAAQQPQAPMMPGAEGGAEPAAA